MKNYLKDSKYKYIIIVFAIYLFLILIIKYCLKPISIKLFI